MVSKFSILQGSTDGTAVYVEIHAPTTNVNGLASLEIGDGNIIAGNFASIDWANGPYFIKNETDPDGGTNYTVTGTFELLAVPYALHALNVENKDDADADPTNEIELPEGGQDGQLLRIVEGVPAWVYPDIEPPTIPNDLSFSNMTPNSLDLTWSPSTDNIAVGGYRILQDGSLISGTTTDTMFQASGLIPLTSYEFAVPRHHDSYRTGLCQSRYSDYCRCKEDLWR